MTGGLGRARIGLLVAGMRTSVAAPVAYHRKEPAVPMAVERTAAVAVAGVAVERTAAAAVVGVAFVGSAEVFGSAGTELRYLLGRTEQEWLPGQAVESY
jgi:hypothetical protein